MPLFVIIENNGQYHPQKWTQEHTVDGKPVATVFKCVISDHEHKHDPLDVLRRRYAPDEFKT